MKLLPKQDNAVYFLKDDITTEIVFGGAAGGGKSALGCLWLIEMCQTYPGTRWLMAREVLKTLKETTLNTFFEESTKLKINDQWEYKEQKGIIQWNNGSQIILKELKFKPTDREFDALGSLEITGGFIDEIAQIVLKAWTVSKSRIRYKLKDFCHICACEKKTTLLESIQQDGVVIPEKWLCSNGHETRGLTPKLLGTCNPSKNWVYKLFYGPQKKKEIAEFRAFIQSLPKDNPYLPKSYIDTLDNMDEKSRRRLRDGDWEYDDDKSALISYDAILDYWNGEHIQVQLDPKGIEIDKRYLTIDVARKGKDKTIFRVWKGWICVKRYEMKISSIPQIIEKAITIQKAFKIKNSLTIADEDGVGGGVVDGLRCKGFINNSSPLNKENYENLKSQCSIRMANRIERREVVELCDDPEVIEMTSEEMEQIKYKDLDKDGKQGVVPKETIKALIGRSPDDWDSIMMREWFDLYIVEHKIFTT
jgi:hypothetical protein